MSWLRRHVGLLLALYVVLLVVVLLSPTSVPQWSAVRWAVQLLRDLGLPRDVTRYSQLEILSNIVIIAPLTFLASLLRPSYGWRDWTALGFVASSAVEALQGLLLPDRHASFSDIVANTLGALVGAVLARLVLRRGR